MKKKYLFERNELPENLEMSALLSTNSVTQSNSGSSALTLESLQKAIDYIRHPDRQKEQQEAAIAQMNNHKLLAAAWEQKIISESEFYWLLLHIDMHGMLIVSPEYYKRLKKVKLDD